MKVQLCFVALLAAFARVSYAEKYLYVWAGATNATLGKDALVTLSLEQGKKFGSIVSVTETPYNNLEPHHCSVSSDGKHLGASGLLAVLSGLPSIFFFDLSNPAKPAMVPVKSYAQPAKGNIPDEVLPTPDGGFLITDMGSPSGFSPGSVARYDNALSLTGEFPSDANYLGNPGFNPHGIAADWKTKSMVTVDFVEPGSTLAAVPGMPVLRNSTRVWDISTPDFKMTNVLVADNGNSGMMDVTFLETSGSYMCTSGDGRLYLVTLKGPKGAAIKAVSAPIANVGFQMIRGFRRGTRALWTQFGNSKVVLLDTTQPHKPKVLSEVKFPAGAGAHVVKISADERLASVATYFLDEGAAGKVRAPGDLTVRFVTIDKWARKLTSHPTVVDFKKAMGPKGVYRPHGLAFSKV